MLFYFVEHAGHIARKSDLLDAVWTDSYVEETTLARNVSWLRKKLAEYSNGEPLIETVPKLGYRFTAEVTRSSTVDENPLIVEEQIVQHIRGEETIEFDGEAIDKKAGDEIGNVEWEKIHASSRNVPSSRRRLSSFTILLIIVIAVSTFVGISFVNYTKNLEPAAQPVG